MKRLQPGIITVVAATYIEWRLAVFEKRLSVIGVAEGEVKDYNAIRDRTV
jgi:hypothetical protein